MDYQKMNEAELSNFWHTTWCSGSPDFTVKAKRFRVEALISRVKSENLEKNLVEAG